MAPSRARFAPQVLCGASRLTFSVRVRATVRVEVRFGARVGVRVMVRGRAGVGIRV